MLIMEYKPLSENAIPDGNLVRLSEMIRKTAYANSDVHLIYSTENIFNQIRMDIAEGRISSEYVLFRVDGFDYRALPDGDLENWPRGFLSIAAETSKRILFAGINQRRISRGEQPYA